jgi:hypothetical protein
MAAMTMRTPARLCAVLVAAGVAVACRGAQNPSPADAQKPAATATASQQVPQSLAMGGAKSVMTFFVTSTGSGKGGDLGGLAGADAHCAALAKAEGAGDHTWRAYLSASATAGQPAVDARTRIGKGPWYNAEGLLIAANLDELHSRANHIGPDTAVSEKLDPVRLHDMLTGSRPDGTAYAEGGDMTCRNWTSSNDAARSLVTTIAAVPAASRTRGTQYTRRMGAVSPISARPAVPGCSTASPLTEDR